MSDIPETCAVNPVEPAQPITERIDELTEAISILAKETRQAIFGATFEPMTDEETNTFAAKQLSIVALAEAIERLTESLDDESTPHRFRTDLPKFRSSFGNPPTG